MTEYFAILVDLRVLSLGQHATLADAYLCLDNNEALHVDAEMILTRGQALALCSNINRALYDGDAK